MSWVLDDAPFFLFTGQRGMQAPGPVLQGWLTELDGITAVHGVTTFTFHPQLIGRPSRLACLHELIEYVRHTPRALDRHARRDRRALANTGARVTRARRATSGAPGTGAG